MVRSSRRGASRPGPRLAQGWIAGRTAWRIRARATMILVSGWIALHTLAPEASTRRTWLSLVALLLGYGHLLGASSSSWRGRGSGLDRLFVGLSAASALCAFTWAMHGAARLPALAGLGVVAVWHILENDRAMGQAGDAGRLPPLSLRARHHAISLGGALLVLVIGLAALRAGPRLAAVGLDTPLVALEELAAAILLYHAIAWILFVLECTRNLPALAARARRRRLLFVHALPVALLAAAWRWLPDVHVVLASPALYLFWSGLHALETARARGLETA